MSCLEYKFGLPNLDVDFKIPCNVICFPFVLQPDIPEKEPQGPGCRDYFWLVCRFVDSISKEDVKIEKVCMEILCILGYVLNGWMVGTYCLLHIYQSGYLFKNIKEYNK